MTTELLGKSVGPYRLVEQLGSTGAASVYRAEDLQRGGEVALKVLRPLFASDTAAVQRFVEEVARVRQLNHPGILPIVDVVSSPSEAWVASRYVVWPTLQQYLRQPIPLTRALRILDQVAEVLDYAHAHGVIHRDLKPRNVFVNPEDGQVLVADFGMSLLVEVVDPMIKDTLSIPLPPYNAPERAQGLASDARSDVYSLGALAYHMLTGTMPFFALSPHTVLAKQLFSAPLPPSELNSQLPLLVDGVLIQALARSPQSRHATAGALVEALHQALQDADLQHLTTKPLQEVNDQAGRRASLAQPSDLPFDPASRTIVCPVCGHVNPSTMARCGGCWANLATEERVEKSEEQRKVRAYRLRVLRERVVGGAVGVLALGGIGLWTFLQVVYVGALPSASAPAESALAGPDTWALDRHDFQNTAFVSSGPTAGIGQVKWTFKTDGPLPAAPAVVGNRVYLGTGGATGGALDWRLIALDRATGQPLREFPAASPLRSTPAVTEDTLFLGLQEGKVVALDRVGDDLTLLWAFDTDNYILGAPVVKDGTVYIGSADKRLHALDAVTGKRLWFWETGAEIVSAPAFIADNILVVASGDGHAYFLDTGTGRKRLTFQMTTAISSSPTAAGDRAFLISRNGGVSAVDGTAIEYPGVRGWQRFRNQLWFWGILSRPTPQKGLNWATTIRGPVSTGPALAHDTLYITTESGRLYALNAKEGSVRWQVKVDADTPTAPVVAGSSVLVGNQSGLLQAFDALTGESLWQFAAASAITASPAVVGNELYLPSADGTLYVLQF